MQIAIVASSCSRFEPGGKARFMGSIAEAQAARNHDVYVSAPHTPQVQSYA